MKVYSKPQWLEIGGKRFYARSQAEVQFAKILEYLKSEKVSILDWHYEPETFWFDGIRRGVTNYKPDFKVIYHDGTHHWFEVKGYLDTKSKTKLKRFMKYYPNEIIKLVMSKDIKKTTLNALIFSPHTNYVP
jgi:hypothetical protein